MTKRFSPFKDEIIVADKEKPLLNSTNMAAMT